MADAEGCGDHVLLEAELGVNVINWFAANLAVVEGTPTVQHQLNLSCVAWVAAELRRKQLPTAHILSIGGWNAPHVDTTLHGAEWWTLFEKWNRETVARDGFAGGSPARPAQLLSTPAHPPTPGARGVT